MKPEAVSTLRMECGCSSDAIVDCADELSRIGKKDKGEESMLIYTVWMSSFLIPIIVVVVVCDGLKKAEAYQRRETAKKRLDGRA